MSSIQAGITKSQDGGTPSGDRGTGKSRGTAEKIQPQSELKSHLEKTARFIKAFDILVRGFAWLSCILAAWLLSCLVDHWLLPLPSVLRWFVWAGLVAFTVWIAVWQIAPLIIGRINPDYAAKRIERAEPRFKEGLIAWLQLSDMPDSGVPRGVMSALTYRAYRFIGGQDPSSTVDSSPLIRGLASFLILACVMALYSFVSPKSSLATAARIAMPWRTVAAPTRVQLSEVVPGSTIVSAGKPLEVSVRAVGVRPGEPVHLVFSTRDGQIVSQAITLDEPDVGSIYSGVLTTTSAGVEHELEYWIEAGDAVTEKFAIDLAPTPSVVLERVELVYPAYTKLPKRISDGRDVEALEGTIATIVARSNQDLVRGQLEINPTQGPDGLLLTAEQIFPMDVRGRELKREWQPLLGEGQPSNLVRYSVRGYNERSDPNLNPIEHSLTLVADVPPEVRLVGPKNRILRVRPRSKVQLEIRASDPDFGLNEVELSVHKAGSAVASRVILKGDGLKGKQVKRQPLDIGRLSMSPGDRLELHATARDNRHDPVSGKWSPNETHADPLIVEVVGPTQPSDVPSGNESAGSDGQPSPDDPSASGSDNPRPGPGDSANGETQPNDSSQADGKNGSTEQDQTGAGQSSSQDGGEKGGEQSGAGGAGSSSDDSGEAQSSSEQSGGGGSSSSSSEDAAQEYGSSGGSSSTGQSGSSGNEQKQGVGAGGNSQDRSQNQSSGGSQNGNGQSDGENASGNNQPRNGNSAQRSSSQDGRGGADGSPSSDAEAMKQVEQFMREKGEAPSQSSKSGSGGQTQKSDGKGQQDTASSDGQSSDGASNNATSNDPAQQSSGSDSSDSQASENESSAKRNQSTENQSSTGSNQRPGENGSQNPDGQKSDSQNSGGQNSDGQNADEQDSGNQSGGGNNQENSSSQQNGDSPQQSSNDNSSNSNSNSNSGGGSESGKGSQTGSESGSQQSGSEQSGSQQSGSGSQDGQGGESSSGQSQDSASGKSGDGKSGQSGSSESAGKSGSQSAAGQENSGQQGSGQQGKEGASGNSEKGQSPNEKGGGKSDSASGQNASSGGQDAGQNPNNRSGEQNQPKNPSAQQQKSGDESATNGQSGDQQSSSQESGSQSSGQQQSSQSPGGNKSSTGSGNSDSGSSTNSSGRGSNRGSSNRAGGDVGEAEAADKEAAAKAADMVLDYLDRQRDQPDPELLREVNWDKNDLNRFVDRWKQARDLASQGDDAAQQNWDELLTALNLSNRSGSLGPMQRSDNFQQMSDSAVRAEPPKSLLKRWEAVQRALEKR